jgi:O-antigen/teichoic acid export membrane protein
VTRPGRAATRAVSDAFWGTLGQAGGLVAGLLAALVLPRLLGAATYGDWVLLRGLMSFVVLFSIIGTPEIMARFHVAHVAAGEDARAAQVVKLAVVVRALLAVAAVVAFLLMAPGRIRLPGGTMDLVLLVAAISCQGGTMIMSLLLYGHRDFSRLAVFHALQPATVPLLVVLAHRSYGFAGVPAAVAAGDAAMLVLTTVLAGRRWRWPAGWLPRHECAMLLKFGAVVGLASLGYGAFQTMIPYAMHVRGFEATAVGYVGLATRLSGLVSLLLGTVGVSLFPSMTQVLQQDGMDRMLRWNEMSTRAGVLTALLVTGATALASPWIVPLLFGPEYAPASPIVALGMATTAPLWVGGQLARVGLLVYRPRLQVVLVGALLLAFLSGLVIMSCDDRGISAAWAAFAGSVAYAAAGGWFLRALLPLRRATMRWIGPVGVTALAVAAAGRLPATVLFQACALTGWLLLFPLVVRVSGVMGRGEVLQVLQAVRSLRNRTRHASGPEEPTP